MPKYELAGRTVVITGSTGGLGSAIASALRARGANLALLDLNQDLVDNQAAELGSESVARGWQVDVRSLDSLQSAIDAAAAHFGRVDVVIANAGIAPMADENAWQDVIDVNLTGVYNTLDVSTRPMVKAGNGGSIVLISSVAGLVGIGAPMAGSVGYAAAKHGMVGGGANEIQKSIISKRLLADYRI